MRRIAQGLRDNAGELAMIDAANCGNPVKEMAGDAGEKAVEFRDAVGDKVREHPFAAIGIALAAGYLIASLSNRR